MSLVTARRLLNSANSISNILQVKSPKECISVQGWVSALQHHPSFYFLKISDGLSARKLQAVVPVSVVKNVKLGVGDVVSLRGNWVKSKGKQQDMELLASECSVSGHFENTRIQNPNYATRKDPHLRVKTSSFAALLRLRSRLNLLTHNFFTSKDFHHIDPPLLSQNDCEGAGEAFSIKSSKHSNFFATDSEVYLQVSTQLHLEAMTGGIPNVYTITPVFRADNASHHLRLAEFRMLEAECAFVDSVAELIDFLEEYLRFIVQEIKKNKEDVKALEDLCDRTKMNLLKDLNLDQSIPRIRFTEAVSILEAKGEKCSHSFTKNQELKLVKDIGGVLFVTHMPSLHKPFYMKNTDDGKYVENFELLAPVVGELAGGSVREDQCKILAERLKGSPFLDWYIELRSSGYPKSSGFGLGFERLMQSIFGIQDIKETVPFPRWYKGMNC